MRGGIVSAILIGAGSVAAANAADISAGFNVNGNIYSPLVSRIEPVIVFDYEPGVMVRTYWLPPWRNRHYFPRTGKCLVTMYSPSAAAFETFKLLISPGRSMRAR